MARIDEVAGIINNAVTQLQKAKAEITSKIDALTAALANTELPADATAALDALRATAQSLDDVVPDAPAEPPV